MSKKRNNLNHWYFQGQVFELTQKIFNEIVEDVHTLRNELKAAAEVFEKYLEEEAGLEDYSKAKKAIVRIEPFLRDVWP